MALSRSARLRVAALVAQLQAEGVPAAELSGALLDAFEAQYVAGDLGKVELNRARHVVKQVGGDLHKFTPSAARHKIEFSAGYLRKKAHGAPQETLREYVEERRNKQRKITRQRRAERLAKVKANKANRVVERIKRGESREQALKKEHMSARAFSSRAEAKRLTKKDGHYIVSGDAHTVVDVAGYVHTDVWTILESPGFAQNSGSCGDAEGLHLVGVLTFGNEFREDVGLVGIQQ